MTSRLSDHSQPSHGGTRAPANTDTREASVDLSSQVQSSGLVRPVHSTDATHRGDIANTSSSVARREHSEEDVDRAAKIAGKLGPSRHSPYASRLLTHEAQLVSADAAMQSTLRRMDSKPLGDDPLRPPGTASPKKGKQASSPSPPRPTFHSIFQSVPARQSRRIAQHLLELVTCASCGKPFTNPVTLPCGHSTCSACISQRITEAISTNRDRASSSRASHVPPRLPLCSITVPCSVTGCPRSAIGQGLGMWAGYTAAYGPADDSNPSESGESDTGGNSDDAGVLPVDGFVVGAENESLGLGVIPPQHRNKANMFALDLFSPSDSESVNMLSLRVDVVLAKAVSVLSRFAAEPPGGKSTPSSSSSMMRRPWRVRSFSSNRRFQSSSGTTSSFRSNTNNPSHRSSSRRGPEVRPGATRIAPQFRALLGGSEIGRESGTISGIRAADTDDDDEDEEEDIYRNTSYLHQQRRHDNFRRRATRSLSVMSYEQEQEPQHPTHTTAASAESLEQERGHDGDDDADLSDVYVDDDEENEEEEEDDDDDDFGGAFARPCQPRGYGEEAEERRRQALLRKKWRVPAKGTTIKEESEWDTDHSVKAVPAEAAAADELASQANSGAVSLASKHKDSDAPATDSQLAAAKLLTPEHLLSDLTDALECQLCYLLFYEPVTTPCGHTFCRTCFARSLDHSNKCPLCRASMPSFAFFQNHALNQSLLRLLTSHMGAPPAENSKRRSSTQEDANAFPEEELMSLSRLGVFADSHHAASPMSPSSSQDHKSDWSDDSGVSDVSFGLRNLYKQRVDAVAEEGRESSVWMPIFVCTLAFPGMPTNLHIFEPRYRLMVRRCLQGSGPARFGMVLPSRSPDSPQYGTMLEIKSCQMLLDGRSMLETVGWKRFKLLETGSLDGYSTGRVEYIDDITPQEAAAEEAQVTRHNARLERRRRGSNNVTDAVNSSILQAEDAAVHSDEDGSNTSVVLPSVAVGGSTNEVAEPRPTMAELVSSCSAFIELLRTQTPPGLFDQIIATYGAVPQPLETDRLSWWLGMVLPIDEHAKSLLLPVRSPRQRLEMIVKWIDRVKASWGPIA